MTLIGRLQTLWGELMPHRRLVFAERTIRAARRDGDAKPFEGSQMSDGERLIVHVLGQALLLEPNGVLIIDEPELHMSRALFVRLWDVVERDRSDCSFVYITHDVEFAASRRAARFYAVLDYVPPTHKEILVLTRKRIVEDRPPR